MLRVSSVIGNALDRLTPFRLLILSAGILLFWPSGMMAQSSAPSVNHTNYNADKTLRSNARINPSTLAMELSIPLPSYPGRAGVGLPASLEYSSKVWGAGTPARHSTQTGGSTTFLTTQFAGRSSGGWTSTLGVPQIDEEVEIYGPDGQAWVPSAEAESQNGTEIFYIKRFRIIMPDGSTHELRADDAPHSYGDTTAPGVSYADRYSGTFLAVDGSRMRLEWNYTNNVWHNTLYLADGSRYLDLPFWNYDFAVDTTYLDRNGNQMFYHAATSAATGQWTDVMGRTLVNPLQRNAQSPQLSESTLTYTYPGLDANSSQTVQLIWQKLSTQQSSLSYTGPAYCNGGSTTLIPTGASQLFDGSYNNQIRICGTAAEFDPVVLTEVRLANGAKYQFHYNIYGEVERIDYPTGGYERFEYAQIPPIASTGGMSYDQFNRGVITRWVSTDGLSEEPPWHYEVERKTTSTTQGPYHVQTFAPDGTWSEQLLKDQWSKLSEPYGFGDAAIGRAYETSNYDNTTNKTLLRRTLTAWTSTGAVTVGGVAGDSHATRDLRPEKEVAIIFDPSSSDALAQMSETVYDTGGSSDLGQFAALNVKQAKAYNYKVLSATTAQMASMATLTALFSSSDVAAVAETDYLYNSDYKARGIVGLASESRTIDPSTSQVKAKSQITYDEASYLESASITNALYWTNPNSSVRALPTTTKRWTDITNNQFITTHAAYDQFGNLRKSWDGRGQVSEVQYDAIYNFAYPTKMITPVPDTSGAHGSSTAFETTTAYHFATGLPLSTTDANGQTTQMSYADPTTNVIDPLLRIRKVTAANGQQTITEYGIVDSTSGQLSTSQRYVKVKTQIDAVKWKEGYSWFDGIGRTTRTQEVDSHGDVFVETEYDQMGRVKRSTNPYRANETKYWTTPEYDELSRTKMVTLPDGATVQTAYGISGSGMIGTTKTVTDEAGRKRKGIADALGRMTRVIEDPDGQNLATDYLFDTLGNLSKTIQGGQSRYFMYDAVGRVIRSRQPEQGTNASLSVTDPVTGNSQWSVSYAYDAAGNSTLTTDARGISVTGTYDALNRLTIRDYSDSTPDVVFTYDDPNVSYSKGALTKVLTGDVASPLSVTRYTLFDAQGHIKASEQTTDGQTYSFPDYSYNLSGGLVSQTYPSGRIVQFEYNAQGDLSQASGKQSATAAVKLYASDFSYTAAGAVERMKLGNGRWESAQYNSRLQVTQIGLGTVASDTSLLKLEMGYGTATQNNGAVREQKISYAELGQPMVQSYTYDSLNRLESATETYNGGTQSWKQTYSYDRFGNRGFDAAQTTLPNLSLLPAKVFNPTIDPVTNQIVKDQDQDSQLDYDYDVAGNLTRDAEGRLFAYDGENRQQSFGTNGSNSNGATYLYDGQGKRIKKVVGQLETLFVYDGFGHLAAEYENTTPAPNGTHFITADHLGSPRVVTNETGIVISRHDYAAFGEELTANTGSRTTTDKYSIFDNLKQQFTGYERDNENGLDYAQARYYNSHHGRFTSVDPLTASATVRNPQTFNRYTYGLNSPYKFTDPLGLAAQGSYWNNSNPGEGGVGGAFSSALGGGEGPSLYDTLVGPTGEVVGCDILGPVSEPLAGAHEAGNSINSNEPQKLGFEQAYKDCKGELGNAPAPGIVETADIVQAANSTDVDRTLLAFTWYEESGGFEFFPKNGLHARNQLVGDIGPGQVFPGIWAKSPFTNGLSNPFGTNREVDQVFNGDPVENLILTGRALNHPLGAVRGDQREKAAGLYKAGSESGPGYQFRVNKWKNANVKAYDDFFGCLAKKGF